MKRQSQYAEIQPANRYDQLLDLVVPFTTPELTQIAIRAAERLSPGLQAAIRLLKVQVVPFPLRESPVSLDFLRAQLQSFRSELPLTGEILLARDARHDLIQTLRPGSIVILASKRRFWTTRAERLAASIDRAGYRVILIHTDNQFKEDS